MQSELIQKLKHSLKQHHSLENTAYFLMIVRKLLELRTCARPLCHLTFFVDWAFHVRVDRSGAQKTLEYFDSLSPALWDDSNSDSEARRYFLLYAFEHELKDLLDESDADTEGKEWWVEFLKHYFELIANYPALSKQTSKLNHIESLSVTSVSGNDQSLYAWQIRLKSGQEKSLPLSLDNYYSVTPTYGCSPIPWSGNTGALLMIPPGWMLDDEEDLGWLFCAYPLLHTRDKALAEGPFLYANIVNKPSRDTTFLEISQHHEDVVHLRMPDAVFTCLEQSSRYLLRKGIIPSYFGNEYSLYVDGEEGVLVLVLLCPNGEDSRYVPCLKWIMDRGIVVAKVDIKYDEPDSSETIGVAGRI